MAGIDRRQIGVYGAAALAVLAIGLVSLRGSTDRAAEPVPAGAAAAGTGASGSPGSFTAGTRAAVLVVDVAGAVIRPGVYRLPEGSRVVDAIRRAGGPDRAAATGGINRAARLTDGQQVVVPSRRPPAGSRSGSGPTTGGPVSLGTASAADLEEIDGIGPVTARKIIEFRESRGGLGSVEDLDQVSGIGPVTMESLRSALQP